MTMPATIAHSHNLRRTGRRWVGPCPKCGGSNRSDKFNLWDDGGFRCYACGVKGDAIAWHREMEGMSCPDAHEAAGKPCDHHGCAVRSTCRLGDGRATIRRAASVTAPPAASRRRVTEQRDPADIWQAWAAELVAKAAAALPASQEAVTTLADRGITLATARAHRLGWLDHPRQVPRRQIGLEPRDGKDTLWVPAGLLIPIYDQHGRIHRLRVRRSAADRARFRSDLKYVWLDGSGNAPLHIRRESPRGAVIVEAELDAIAIAGAHGQADVLALGTVNQPPTGHQQTVLQQLPVILVALDADGGSAAGQKAVRWWCDTYRHAKYWPVPAGKDPGEYAATGDLAAWIEAGLPPVAGPARAQDTRPAPLSCPAGGNGEDLPPHAAGTSKAGTPFVIAHTAADVETLRRHYPDRAVFAPREIALLKGMDRPDAELVLKAKGIFDNAEIIDTRPLRPRKKRRRKK